MKQKEKLSWTNKLGKLLLSATLVVSAFTAQLAVPKTEAAAAPNHFISNFYVNSFILPTNSGFENTTFTLTPFDMNTKQLLQTDRYSVTKNLENSGVRYISSMAVSPNGNYIGFSYKRANNTTAVYLADRNNNHIRITTTQNGNFFPVDATFSPDNNKLILIGDTTNTSTAKSKVLVYDTSDLANNANPNYIVPVKKEFEITSSFQPSSVVAVGNNYYVAFKAANGGHPTPPSKIEVYSLSDNSHIKTIELSKDSAFSYRVNQLIVSPDGSKIYAHEITDRKVTVINAITNEVESIHSLDGAFFEEADATGTALSPDGETFYVAYKKNYSKPSKSGLAKYDITDGFQLIDTVEIDLPSNPNEQYAGLFPHNVGVSPEGSRVFVHATSNIGTHRIITLNEDTLEKISETLLDNSNNTSYSFPTKQLNFPVQYGYSATLDIDAEPIELTSTLPFTPSIEAVYNNNISVDVTGDEITATSNDTSIVDIVDNKLVAKRNGFTTVTLEYRGATVAVPVTVNFVISTIGFDPYYVNLPQAATLQLEVKGFNSAEQPVGIVTDGITFTTTATNITLTNDGLVTAHEPGPAIVYANLTDPITQTTITSGITINVIPSTLTDLTAVNNTVSLSQGKPTVVDFNAVYGQNTLAINSLTTGVTLQSSDSNIVDVIDNKLVGLSEGSVTITASYQGQQTTFTASVDNLIDRLELDSAQYLLTTSARKAITVTAHYEDGTSEELLNGSGVALSLSNNITSISPDNDDHKYYFLTYNTFLEGEATLTATIGNKSVSALVITYHSITGIYVENNPLEVTVGNSETLTLVRRLSEGNGAIEYYTIDS